MGLNSLPIVILLVAMTSVQIGSSLAKELFPLLGPMGATSMRLTIASVLMLLFWRPWREKIDRKGALKVVLYGASLGLMNFFFFLSLERVPLGIAVALEFMGPLAVAIFASKRRLDYLWAILAGMGIFLLFPESRDSRPLDHLGAFFALISGLFWALYIVFGKEAGKCMSGGTAAAWGMLIAALVASPMGLLTTELKSLSSAVIGKGVAVALLSSAVPYSLEMFALRRMPKRTFGVLMSLEPVLGAIIGFIYLGESLAIIQWLAIGLVILSSAGSTYTAID